MTWLYEIIEYVKRLFVTIFGGYHVHEGDNLLKTLDISIFDRVIFIGVAAVLVLTIWLPKLVKSDKKVHKHVAETIIHIIIVGMIVYEAVHTSNYLRGGVLILLYILFEMSIVLFLTRNKEETLEETVKTE